MRNLTLIAAAYYLALTAVTQVLLTRGPAPHDSTRAPIALARR